MSQSCWTGPTRAASARCAPTAAPIVVEIEPDAEYEHIDSLSRVYMGGAYQWSAPREEPRFKLVIEPRRTRAVDISLPESEIR